MGALGNLATGNVRYFETCFRALSAYGERLDNFNNRYVTGLDKGVPWIGISFDGSSLQIYREDDKNVFKELYDWFDSRRVEEWRKVLDPDDLKKLWIILNTFVHTSGYHEREYIVVENIPITATAMLVLRKGIKDDDAIYGCLSDRGAIKRQLWFYVYSNGMADVWCDYHGMTFDILVHWINTLYEGKSEDMFYHIVHAIDSLRKKEQWDKLRSAGVSYDLGTASNGHYRYILITDTSGEVFVESKEDFTSNVFAEYDSYLRKTFLCDFTI